MANPIYTIKEKPEYQREIPALTTQTPAHAETVLRPLFESVINNTEYVRQRAEEVAGELDEAIEGLTPEGIGAIPTAEKAAAGGVATLDNEGKVPAGQLPAMSYDPAGSAAAVKSSLDSHTGAANPHSGSVPTGRKINGKPLTGDVTLTAGDVRAIPTVERAVAGGIATLGADGKIPETQLPKIPSFDPAASPNFTEKDETIASLETISTPVPILGEGWQSSGNNIYSHTAGYTDALSYRFGLKSSNTYQLLVSSAQMSNEQKFEIWLGNSPNDRLEAVELLIGNNYTYIIHPKEDFEYINVIPESAFNATVNLTLSICTALNSTSLYANHLPVIIKDKNIFFGGGGLISTGTQNMSIGYEALYKNNRGSNNTAAGYQALMHSTSSSNNTAFGGQSLNRNVTGGQNTAIGYQALCNNLTASSNSAVGYQALMNNTTGRDNAAFGGQALLRNTTGRDNAAFGDEALYSNSTGELNVAVGSNALYHNTTGSQNTAVGAYALQNNTTGRQNTALGRLALNRNISGGNNTAIGYNALLSNTTGSDNVVSGAYAMQYNTTGRYNTVSGLYAFWDNTTGSYNVAIGNNSGRSLADSTAQKTSSYSIFLGSDSKGSTLDKQTNQTVIGYGAVGNGSNTITLGNSEITRLYCKATSITSLSDTRVKEDIEIADTLRCLETVKSLPVNRYKYKDFMGEYADKHVTGWLADDVEKIFPKAVSVQDKYFPVLDNQGNPIYETVTESITETDDDGKEITCTRDRQVQKMFLLEDVKEITMTEALPTLWGAVQALAQQVEELTQN